MVASTLHGTIEIPQRMKVKSLIRSQIYEEDEVQSDRDDEPESNNLHSQETTGVFDTDSDVDY